MRDHVLKIQAEQRPYSYVSAAISFYSSSQQSQNLDLDAIMTEQRQHELILDFLHQRLLRLKDASEAAKAQDYPAEEAKSWEPRYEGPPSEVWLRELIEPKDVITKLRQQIQRSKKQWGEQGENRSKVNKHHSSLQLKEQEKAIKAQVTQLSKQLDEYGKAAKQRINR
mmetsp:Transcript_9356/g.15789  ORF Transcript_9356/g.15789 Transcript_9356/m.15789 type:complete len:168 (-) Transcript_9356:31-534(-)